MKDETFENIILAFSLRPSKALKLGEEWIYATNYGQIQKVKGQIYAYIMIQGNRILVQAYPKGETGICALEQRFSFTLAGLRDACTLAEDWLNTYQNDLTDIHLNEYYPFNPHNKINFSL